MSWTASSNPPQTPREFAPIPPTARPSATPPALRAASTSVGAFYAGQNFQNSSAKPIAFGFSLLKITSRRLPTSTDSGCKASGTLRFFYVPRARNTTFGVGADIRLRPGLKVGSLCLGDLRGWSCRASELPCGGFLDVMTPGCSEIAWSGSPSIPTPAGSFSTSSKLGHGAST
jgi:hypothetical protein